MDFIKSKTDIPSRAHRCIYITALRRTPLDRSLTNTGEVDPVLVESCKAYYNYVSEMLSDMYEHADAWHLNPGVYDSYLDGIKENGMKQRQPSRTLTLRAEMHSGVTHYLRYLLMLGKLGLPQPDRLYIPQSEYAKIKAVYDRDFAKLPTGIQKKMAYRQRLDALQRVKLRIIENSDGSVEAVCESYPNMFMSMCALAKAADQVKIFGEHNFYTCDFRQIWNGYTPQYEDVIVALSDEQRAVTDLIHQIAQELKMRISCNTYWKVNYHYKGKHVMCLDTDDIIGEKTGLCHNVRLRVNGSHDDRYLEMIAEKGDAFKRYFIRHLNYCTACSTSHLGWHKEIFGRKVRLCCEPHFRITNPELSDVANIRQFIELRMNMITLELDEKKKGSD